MSTEVVEDTAIAKVEKPSIGPEGLKTALENLAQEVKKPGFSGRASIHYQNGKQESLIVVYFEGAIAKQVFYQDMQNRPAPKTVKDIIKSTLKDVPFRQRSDESRNQVTHSNLVFPQVPNLNNLEEAELIIEFAEKSNVWLTAEQAMRAKEKELVQQVSAEEVSAEQISEQPEQASVEASEQAIEQPEQASVEASEQAIEQPEQVSVEASEQASEQPEQVNAPEQTTSSFSFRSSFQAFFGRRALAKKQSQPQQLETEQQDCKKTGPG